MGSIVFGIIYVFQETTFVMKHIRDIPWIDTTAALGSFRDILFFNFFLIVFICVHSRFVSMLYSIKKKKNYNIDV